MKRAVLVSFLTSVFWISFGIVQPAAAGDVDILIGKLADKGILSRAEAREILEEIRRENPGSGAGVTEIPRWIYRIKPFGDLRIRHDTQWRETDSANYDRNRERFRLRFGFKAETSDDTEVGVRLASGSGFQNTTNQSFDDHARGKDVFIDQAYAKWQQSDHLTLVGGKHGNPLFTTPLVWDPDVNPEGVSELLSFDVNEGVAIFANLGQWFVEELNLTTSNSDPTLLAFQLGSQIKPSEKATVVLGATYYDYLHLENLEWESGVLSDPESFLGYNQAHGQQMVFDDQGNLLNEWKCLELAAEVKFKELLPVPFSIFGDYVKNFDADIGELVSKGSVALAVDSDPADLLAYGGDDRDTGWLLGFGLGNKKKRGDWYFRYHYQVLEDYAFPAVFVDSDFHGGGTNNEGHYLHGRYFLADNIQAAATCFLTEREDEAKDGKRDEDRIQLDVIVSFP